jgi:hypothetical protein
MVKAMNILGIPQFLGYPWGLYLDFVGMKLWNSMTLLMDFTIEIIDGNVILFLWYTPIVSNIHQETDSSQTQFVGSNQQCRPMDWQIWQADHLWPNSYCCEETDMDFLWGSPIVSSMYWILLVIPSNSYSLGYSNIPQRTLSYWLYPKLWGYNLINKYPCCWWYPVNWHSYIHTHAHCKSLSCYFSQMVYSKKYPGMGNWGWCGWGMVYLKHILFGQVRDAKGG